MRSEISGAKVGHPPMPPPLACRFGSGSLRPARKQQTLPAAELAKRRTTWDIRNSTRQPESGARGMLGVGGSEARAGAAAGMGDTVLA